VPKSTHKSYTYCPSEIYAGHVACCPSGEHAKGTEKRTNARCGKNNKRQQTRLTEAGPGPEPENRKVINQK